MSLRRPQKFKDVEYKRLYSSEDFVDAQLSFFSLIVWVLLSMPPRNRLCLRMLNISAGPSQDIPWKAVALAFVLCFGGTVFLITGTLLFSGYLDTKYADRMWPLLILGTLMFIPGAYHVRVAYCAFRRYPGYSFSDIPQFS